MKSTIILSMLTLLFTTPAFAEEITVKGVVSRYTPAEKYPAGVSRIFVHKEENDDRQASLVVEFAPGIFADNPICTFSTFREVCYYENMNYQSLKVACPEEIGKIWTTHPSELNFICVGEKP